ncbi:hypothetical protein FHP25_36000 [Vineibacter terrae]|uniref:Uncharacterized protein n=1 Tax=Vineibacter terrae TaxID=2586908 RepID=A0A5C8PA70_9HYPH|nr:hypothetical protein [Vineibacter terrae]TXL70128.1 hypothetical protein FHP25_36000 [Vineibacter terrae]
MAYYGGTTMTRAEFRACVEAHLQSSGESATAFGRRALNDPGFVFDLRRGRDTTLSVVERVQQAIADWVPSTPAPVAAAPAAQAAG